MDRSPFHCSCGYGVCGSDAMNVSGLHRLARKLLIRNLSETVTIWPLLAFRVMKDLVVDLDPFFAQYRKIKPYLITNEPPPLTERLQTPEQRAHYNEGAKCILCASSCQFAPSHLGQSRVGWSGSAGQRASLPL